MNLPALPFRPSLVQELLNILFAPFQKARPQRQSQALKAVQHGDKLEGASLSEFGIGWPLADGDFEFTGGYVNEASVFHPFAELVAIDPKRNTKLLDGFFLIGTPLLDITIRW